MHFTTQYYRVGQDILKAACGREGSVDVMTSYTDRATCGNCKRTRAFKDAAKSGVEILADMLSLDGTTPATIETIPSARTRYADAGFFTGFTGSNRQTSQNFQITGIFADGSCEVTATGQDVTRKFLSLTDFLMWITPQGVHIGRILDCVIGDGMTWVAAMDHEYALEAERDSVNAIETAINDGFGIRFLSDASHKVTTHEAPANGRTLYYADCSCGYGSGLYAESNDARDVAEGHGKVSRPLPDAVESIKFSWAEVMEGYRAAHPIIAEDAEGAVKVWRASGSKVKSTSRARRFRKGA